MRSAFCNPMRATRSPTSISQLSIRTLSGVRSSSERTSSSRDRFKMAADVLNVTLSRCASTPHINRRVGRLRFGGHIFRKSLRSPVPRARMRTRSCRRRQERHQRFRRLGARDPEGASVLAPDGQAIRVVAHPERRRAPPVGRRAECLRRPRGSRRCAMAGSNVSTTNSP